MEGADLEPGAAIGEVVDDGQYSDPPAGWPHIGVVMTNLDRSVDAGVEALLREGGTIAQHSAWDFCGHVWFQGGRWRERVMVHHEVVASYQADDLKTLMGIVNDRHGWS